MALTKYVDYQPTTQPTFLQNQQGWDWGRGLGYVKDLVVETWIYGVRSYFITIAPLDALPYVGDERQLERYPFDSLGDYVARLVGAWKLWPWVGTALGLKRALATIGFANVVILENESALFPTSSDPTDDWARFAVLIYPPHGFSPDSPTWGDFDWGDGTVWGFTYVPSGAPYIRNVIQTWKLYGTELFAAVVVTAGAGDTLTDYNVWGGWNFTTDAPFSWGDGSKWGGSVSRI